MKIAVFGGTGFVGTHIVEAFTNQDQDVCVFVRNLSDVKVINRNLYSKVIKGNINDESQVVDFLKGAKIVIYAIGIIRSFEHKGISFQEVHFDIAKRCIDIAQKSGVSHFIMISANGARLDGTEYQRTKFLAEEYLRNSTLDYTILRPSVIFGDPKGCQRIEFCTQLDRDLLGLPIPFRYFVPIFFKGWQINKAGKYHLSPIAVEDMAYLITQISNNPQHFNKTYLVGGNSISFKDIITTINKAKKQKRLLIPTPAFIIAGLAKLFQPFQWFPISADQLHMLLEGNTTDSGEYDNLVDIFAKQHHFTSFDEQSLSYLVD